MKNDNKQILEELKEIKSDIKYLKEHIQDPDTILDYDDLESLKEAEEDLKKGRTKRLI